MVIPKAKKLLSTSEWVIYLRIGGENITVTESTQRRCEDLARRIKSDYKLGKRKKPVGVTLLQAINIYIDSRDNVLSPSTIRGYEAIKKSRLQDHMNSRLSDIADWQAIINAEAASCSPKYIQNIWGLVASVLKYHKQEVPRITLPQVAAKDKPWLEPEDIPLFLEAIRGDICEFEILLALHGLRSSEVQAVDKSKVELRKDFINVSGSVVLDKNNKPVHKETNKNKPSKRVVPILIPRLYELSECDMVKHHPQTVYKHINKACRKIGIEPVGTQGLRRSFASLCYHLRLSERETMDLGGWSDANVMREIYIKLAKRDKEQASEKLKSFYKNIADESQK
jgi:integrase